MLRIGPLAPGNLQFGGKNGQNIPMRRSFAKELANLLPLRFVMSCGAAMTTLCLLFICVLNGPQKDYKSAGSPPTGPLVGVNGSVCHKFIQWPVGVGQFAAKCLFFRSAA